MLKGKIYKKYKVYIYTESIKDTDSFQQERTLKEYFTMSPY